MKRSQLYSVLEIPGFLTQVHLGCGREERAHPQSVVFSIKVGFHSPLEAEISEVLEQTLCYAQVCQRIQKVIEGRSYHLVESLALSVKTSLQTLLPQGATLQVGVHKLNPPVEGLTDGVLYTTGDMTL